MNQRRRIRLRSLLLAALLSATPATALLADQPDGRPVADANPETELQFSSDEFAAADDVGLDSSPTETSTAAPGTDFLPD
ncbi:MAG: hypothetical protein AAFP90_18135, partial [Planctomycetota bacterium]